MACVASAAGARSCSGWDSEEWGVASTPGTRAGLQPSPCLAPGALSPERVESGMRAGARAVPAQRECGARARAPDFPTEDGRTREGSLQQGLSTEMSRGPLVYLKKKKKQSREIVMSLGAKR